MCGRFATTYTGEAIAELFNLPQVPQLPPRYNIAPSQSVGAVRVSPGNNGRELTLLKWGLIPSWAEDSAIGNRMINARADTLSEKPSFRNAFKRRRCLVPASGYYEWRKSTEGKQPVYIRMKEERPFAMAGLWESWQPSGGSEIQSCTVITTESNELLKPVHHRMPVIVADRDFEHWLDPDIQGQETLESILQPYPSDKMTFHPVSTLVNSAKNDTPECIEPLR